MPAGTSSEGSNWPVELPLKCSTIAGATPRLVLLLLLVALQSTAAMGRKGSGGALRGGGGAARAPRPASEERVFAAGINRNSRIRVGKRSREQATEEEAAVSAVESSANGNKPQAKKLGKQKCGAKRGGLDTSRDKTWNRFLEWLGAEGFRCVACCLCTRVFVIIAEDPIAYPSPDHPMHLQVGQGNPQAVSDWNS